MKAFLFIQEQRTPREKPIPNFQFLRGNHRSGRSQEGIGGKDWSGLRNQFIASNNSNPGISYRELMEPSLLEIFLPQPDRDNLSTEGWTRWAPEMPPNLHFPLILKMPGVLL